MRQEVERMREVMRQNYEEMRQLRAQNQQMHSDVKDIKDLLLKGRVGQPSPRGPGAGTTAHFTGLQRPITATSPVQMLKPAEYSSRSPTSHRGSPNPRSPSQGVTTARQSGPTHTSTIRQSLAEAATRPSSRAQAHRSQQGRPAAAGVGGGAAAGGGSGASKPGGTLPAICSLKDQPGPSASKAAAPGGGQRTKSALRLSTGKGVRK